LARHPFSGLEVDTGHVDFLKPGQHFGREESSSNRAHELSQCIVTGFDSGDSQARIGEQCRVCVTRSCVRQTRDPGHEIVQLITLTVGASDVAEAYSSAVPEHARELPRGGWLIWERAEGTFADDRVYGLVHEWPALHVGAFELHQGTESEPRGFPRRPIDILSAEIEAGYATPESLRQQQRARSATGRRVHHVHVWRQLEHIAQSFGELKATRVKRVSKKR
jgi:hypothetical protein